VVKRNQDRQKEAAMTENTPSPLGNVISIDDERIKTHLDRVVRGEVRLKIPKLRQRTFVTERMGMSAAWSLD